MNQRMRVFTLMAVVLVAGSLLLAQDKSPFVGTWKLNVEKSKYNPGPPPKTQTRTWDAKGMVMVQGVNAAGKQLSYGYTILGDKAEYPTMGNIPNGADKIRSEKVDAYTYRANFTKAGTHVESTLFKLSHDGKTLMIHARGMTDAGAFDNLQIWERQ
jgi:hypothetical protein